MLGRGMRAMVIGVSANRGREEGRPEGKIITKREEKRKSARGEGLS